MSTTPDLEFLKHETLVTKEASHSLLRKLHKSTCSIKLTNDLTQIFYTKEGKSPKILAIASIRRLVPQNEKSQLGIEAGQHRREFTFKNKSDFEKWYEGLKYLTEKHAEKVELDDPLAAKARNMWTQMDSDANGDLSYAEVVSVLKKLNFNSTDSITEQELIRKYDVDNTGNINFQEFLKLYKELANPDKMSKSIFQQYAGLDGIMTAQELENFLVESQKVPQDEAAVEAKRICEKYGHNHKKGNLIHPQEHPDEDDHELDLGEYHLDIHQFLDYLYGPENIAYDPKQSVEFQDMTFPLSHYYIFSSHNTYLEGNQLTGAASSQAYRTTIEAGAKCVELDVWDGEDGEPTITHGHTLTGKMSFADAINVLPQVAFKSSPYPFILSIENHCSPSQQVRMAQIMLANEDFAKNIVKAADPEKEKMASPAALKGRYILKCKIKDETAKEFAELVYLSNAKEFKSLDVSMDNKWNQMHSFSESDLKTILEKGDDNQRAKFQTYNLSHMSRTYPGGVRVDSSNYDPFIPLLLGCQIVAFNFQSIDSELVAYGSTFLRNGSCGYVLKPEYALGGPQPTKLTSVKVRIIAAHNVPMTSVTSMLRSSMTAKLEKYVSSVGTIATYVTAGYSAEDHKVDTKDVKTESVKNNDINPVYSTSASDYFIASSRYPEISNIIFKIRCDVTGKDTTLALSAINMAMVRNGYRMLPLRDSGGKMLPTSQCLICHFECTTL